MPRKPEHPEEKREAFQLARRIEKRLRIANPDEAQRSIETRANHRARLKYQELAREKITPGNWRYIKATQAEEQGQRYFPEELANVARVKGWLRLDPRVADQFYPLHIETPGVNHERRFEWYDLADMVIAAHNWVLGRYASRVWWSIPEEYHRLMWNLLSEFGRHEEGIKGPKGRYLFEQLLPRLRKRFRKPHREVFLDVVEALVRGQLCEPGLLCSAEDSLGSFET